MALKKTLITLFTLVLMALPSWAQNNQAEAQQVYQLIQLYQQQPPRQLQGLQILYMTAQQSGNVAEMRKIEMEVQMNQAMAQGMSNLIQNPQPLMNPQVRQQVLAGLMEYGYRTAYRDMRPWEQIQGNVAAYAQQQGYNASVAGINANTAANTAAHNGRMNSMYAQNAAHQQNMANMQGQWASDQQAWNNQQNSNYASHQQYVHGINNEYRYVDPNTNQGYWVPMSNENPAVINGDGTYTPLQPYHNY